MVNEAELVTETEIPMNFVVANATGIEKGAILKLTDNMTASIADGADDLIAGIAAAEKIASDGITRLAVYRGGRFRLTASGAITTGDAIGTSAGADNTVKRYDSTQSGCRILGYALEDVADGAQFIAELRPTNSPNI